MLLLGISPDVFNAYVEKGGKEEDLYKCLQKNTKVMSCPLENLMNLRDFIIWTHGCTLTVELFRFKGIVL